MLDSLQKRHCTTTDWEDYWLEIKKEHRPVEIVCVVQ